MWLALPQPFSASNRPYAFSVHSPEVQRRASHSQSQKRSVREGALTRRAKLLEIEAALLARELLDVLDLKACSLQRNIGLFDLHLAVVRDSSHKRLRTFCVAARRRSFKAAADELCVTPSAVSHQIKILEQQLQAKLFLRRTHAIVLTDLGAELLAQIDSLIVELDDAVARFKRSAHTARTARARASARQHFSR